MKKILFIFLLLPTLGFSQVSSFMGRYDVSKVDSVNDSIWKLTGTFVDVTGSWTALDADTGDKIIQRGYNSSGKVVFDRYVVTGISSSTAVNLVVFAKSDFATGVQNMTGMPFTGSFPIATSTSDTSTLTYRASFYQNSIDPDYDAALDNLNIREVNSTNNDYGDTLASHNERINQRVRSVTATLPVVSSGGYTPNISIDTTKVVLFNDTLPAGKIATKDMLNDSAAAKVYGSGTTNYIPKWTNSKKLGNSLIYDNGTNIGIGTVTSMSLLTVNGTITKPTSYNPTAGFNWVSSVSTTDDVMLLGYNVAPGTRLVDPAEPAVMIGLESNFYDGSNNVMEGYFQALNTSGRTRRPFFFTYNRDLDNTKLIAIKGETISLSNTETTSTVNFTAGRFNTNGAYEFSTSSNGVLTLAPNGTGNVKIKSVNGLLVTSEYPLYGHTRLIGKTSGGGLFLSNNIDGSLNLDDVTRTGHSIYMGAGQGGIGFDLYSAGANPRTASRSMFIKDNGFVEIGSDNNPQNPLHVISTTYPQVRLGYNTTNYMTLGHQGIFNLVSSNTQDYNFQQEGTSRLIIKNTIGNVGIGTTAPTTKLDVQGTGRFSGSLALRTLQVLTASDTLLGTKGTVGYFAPNTFAPYSHTQAWTTITGTPGTYTPTTHTHSQYRELTNHDSLSMLDEKSYNSLTDKPTSWAWSAVTGVPASYTPTSHTQDWSTITAVPSSYTPTAHTQAISTITNLQVALDSAIQIKDSTGNAVGNYVTHKYFQDSTFWSYGDNGVSNINLDSNYTLDYTANWTSDFDGWDIGSCGANAYYNNTMCTTVGVLLNCTNEIFKKDAIRPTSGKGKITFTYRTNAASVIELRSYDGTVLYETLPGTSGSCLAYTYIGTLDDGVRITHTTSIWITDFKAYTLIEKGRVNVTGTLSVGDSVVGQNFKITPEGGYAVRMVAGCSLEQGDVVRMGWSNGTVTKTTSVSDSVYENNTVGVAYNTASAGQSVWVVTSGKALVKFTSTYECEDAGVTCSWAKRGYLAAIGYQTCYDGETTQVIGGTGRAVSVRTGFGAQTIGIITETKEYGESAYVILSINNNIPL